LATRPSRQPSAGPDPLPAGPHLHQQLNDHHGQARAWDSLGYARHHLGQHTEAIDCYQHAVNLYGNLGDRHGEADSLTHLGDTHHAAGHPEAADHTWRQALAILDEMQHPDADTVRIHLRSAGSQPRNEFRPR
jgi:tetratricopeptide (TPR) repeat protein